jgi:hypothetical protein
MGWGPAPCGAPDLVCWSVMFTLLLLAPGAWNREDCLPFFNCLATRPCPPSLRSCHSRLAYSQCSPSSLLALAPLFETAGEPGRAWCGDQVTRRCTSRTDLGIDFLISNACATYNPNIASGGDLGTSSGSRAVGRLRRVAEVISPRLSGFFLSSRMSWA